MRAHVVLLGERALVYAADLVQSVADKRDDGDEYQVVECQRCRLEHALEDWHVDDRELCGSAAGNGSDQRLVRIERRM